ncbi:MAG TPA: cystathionine gamma-synthase [Saprospiraceae bacterium]|nr:cystathionine gamma-synthase [Saprospiraceae bacterium]
MKFETKTIHAGVTPDPTTGAIMTPIFQTSTYVQASPGNHKGFEYSRTQNPTRKVLETNLAALENGKYGISFSSGLAAMDAIMKLLQPGDEIVSTNDLYGGSYRQMRQVYEKFGIKSTFISMADASSIVASLSEKTKLIWIETPTNPTLNIIDIEAICKIAKKKGIWTVVDNTFASPYLQNPLNLGADIVLHSATKYINGHSDVVLGALITNSDELGEKLSFIQNATGAVPGPMDSFLTIRGIKTLHVRVQRACENAAIIANHLQSHPKIKNIFWPGLETHPNHKIAAKQMRMFGAMISFDLHDDTFQAANAILENTHLFALAESLGGVESLIGHPASMTHASIPRQERIAAGLNDSLIRLSVGIENVEDLIADLDRALG